MERWTFISPDHHITSVYFLTLLAMVRIMVISFGAILAIYPKIVFHAASLGALLMDYYYKKKRCVPPLSLVILMVTCIVIYLGIIFIGHALVVYEQREMSDRDHSMWGVYTDVLNTGSYFYKTLMVTLFEENIDLTKIDLPISRLYIREELLDTLNADLPESGLEFVPGNLALNGTVYPSKVRYRGDTFYHWYFKKKSWRIKLKDNLLLHSSNKFNIINPKLDSHIQELLAYMIAEKAGLMVPRNYPLVLFINNRYEGVYYYADQIDELFIRMLNKVPGDIFFGELYGDATRSGTLFQNKTNWDLVATGGDNETRAWQEMDALINAIKKNDLEFYHFFNQHLGEEYLRFYALTLLLDEQRVDDFHNHKFYFNPSNGIFEPIVWDIMPFLNRSIPLNSDQTNALFSKINRIPPLVEKRNQLLQEYLEMMPEETLGEYVDTLAASLAYELDHDPFKDSYHAPWVLTNKEWRTSVALLKDAIRDRYASIRRQLANTTLAVTTITHGNTTAFVFDVAGNSGVRIESILLSPQVNPRKICYRLFKDANFNFVPDMHEVVQEECAQKGFVPLIEMLSPGKNDTLRYVYIITTDVSIPLTITNFTAKNSITKGTITPILQEIHSPIALPNRSSQSSLHPWMIPVKKKRTITFSGVQTLTEDLILMAGDMLIITPNTSIRLAPGVSIISYGTVLGEGAPTMPISFVPLYKNRPWGALVLQGNGANGSRLSDCVLEGGSGTNHELVHYTGMLSAYNTDISINHCIFNGNQIYDDAFNAKYSSVSITNSTFTRIFSDAIDLDISEGIVAQNTFSDVKGDAIDLMTSSPLIKNNYVARAGDKGISIGEMSNPIVVDNTIVSSTTGIAIKDNSEPTIINNTITNNTIGIAAFMKNWKYGGGGKGSVSGMNLCQNTKPIVIDNTSFLNVEQDHRMIRCTEKECPLMC